MQLVFTFFDQRMGPAVLFVFPEQIEESIQKKILTFFDFEISETFFEIVLIDEKLKITNLYFELPSEWARGGHESVMISVVTDKDFKFLKKGEFFHETLKETAENIKSIKSVYKALHIDDGSWNQDPDVKPTNAALKSILVDCLEILKGEALMEYGDGRIVKKFKRLKW